MGSLDEEEFQAQNTKEELNMRPQSDADALENVLYHVGEMGRYQKLLFLTMLPFGISFAYVYFVQMFIAATPQRHWCKVPELAHLDMELRRNLSAPGAVLGDWNKCTTYQTNWTKVLETLTPPEPTTQRIPCQHGWEFELVDIPYPTVISERGWVCEYSTYAPTAQSIFFLGSLVGGLFFGWMADKFGRLPAFVGTNLIGSLGGIATAFTTGFWDFAFCRFLVGMSFDNGYMLLYILVLEYVGPRHRTWVANMGIALYFGSGCLSLPWLALWIGDWRKLLWITSAPILGVVFTPLFVPESARWLLSKGRVNKAVAVLRRFEKVNGTKIPDDVMEEFIVTSRKTKQENESAMTLVKNAPLRNTMIIMVIVYMACAAIFDGLVRLSDAFGLDFFITFTLTSATEIPSVTLLAFILDKWGRRFLACVPMALSGFLIMITMFVPKGIPQATLAIMARFCINMTFNTVIQWSTELLPTGVRASGSSFVHMSGYVATFMSPFIVYSERLWTLLPLLILCVAALIASSIGIILPETKGRPMPQTIADGERLVREYSLCGKPEKDDIEMNDMEKKNALIT